MNPRNQFVGNDDTILRGSTHSYVFAGRNLNDIAPEEDAHALGR
jgi:hypothetical protein